MILQQLTHAFQRNSSLTSCSVWSIDGQHNPPVDDSRRRRLSRNRCSSHHPAFSVSSVFGLGDEDSGLVTRRMPSVTVTNPIQRRDVITSPKKRALNMTPKIGEANPNVDNIPGLWRLRSIVHPTKQSPATTTP